MVLEAAEGAGRLVRIALQECVEKYMAWTGLVVVRMMTSDQVWDIFSGRT